MANGFVTTSPTSAPEGLWLQMRFNGTQCAARFTAPGSGNLEISEIGLWVGGTLGNMQAHLAIFTDDAVNACPDTIVADSDAGPVSWSSGSWNVPVKISASYSTKPVIQGGQTYWLAINGNGGTTYYILQENSAGTAIKTAASNAYPTWYTGDAWHSHTDITTQVQLYAVYSYQPVILTPDPFVSSSSLAVPGLLIDKIVAPALTSEGVLFAELFEGEIITADPLVSHGSLLASLKLIVPAELISQSVLSGPPLIAISAELMSRGIISVLDAYCIHDPNAKITYECILSNDDDDITLPIESFQGYFRTNESSYLGVVIPTIIYEDQVNAAITAGSCTLSVYMIKTYSTGNIVRELVQTVDIDETGVRIDEGAANQSMTLSGYRKETRTPKVSVLGSSFKKSTQYSTDGIKYSYQCQPDLFIRAGDTVRIDGNEFTADSIRWEVNVERGQMTVLPV